jgi:hypothetical protein
LKNCDVAVIWKRRHSKNNMRQIDREWAGQALRNSRKQLERARATFNHLQPLEKRGEESERRLTDKEPRPGRGARGERLQCGGGGRQERRAEGEVWASGGRDPPSCEWWWARLQKIDFVLLAIFKIQHAKFPELCCFSFWIPWSSSF